MKKISFENFEKKYMTSERKWNFNLFSIVCKKCKSDNVEYAGESEIESGYYGDIEFEHKIIVKCHGCGNAFGMKIKEIGNSDYCSNCDN